MPSLKLRSYEVLWHKTSGYGGRYERTTVEARGGCDAAAAKGLVAAEECVPSSDIRVDAVQEVEA